MDYSGGSEQIHCFNAENGHKNWSFSYPVSYSVGYPTGPRASLQVINGLAYSFGTMGHLYCFNAETGKVIWQVNTVEQYRSRIPVWGHASNPILVDDKLIVQVGGVSGAGIVAFNRENGKEMWCSLDDESSYSTPVLINQAGTQVLICWTGESISGLNPENDHKYWSIPFRPEKAIINIADPVYTPPLSLPQQFLRWLFFAKT